MKLSAVLTDSQLFEIFKNVRASYELHFTTDHSILNENEDILKCIVEKINNSLFPLYKTSGSHTKFQKVSYS